MTAYSHVTSLVSKLQFICLSGAASQFLCNQNVLPSSILSTVVENSASSSIGSSPPSSVFCFKYEIHTDSEKENVSGAGEEHVENVLKEYLHKGRDVQKRLNEVSCKFGAAS